MEGGSQYKKVVDEGGSRSVYTAGDTGGAKDVFDELAKREVVGGDSPAGEKASLLRGGGSGSGSDSDDVMGD